MSGVFPFVLHTDIGSSITLFADGTFRGNPQLLELWLTKLDGAAAPPHQGTVAAVQLWLLLRAMQDDADSTSFGGQNVFDVHSKSQGTALDGTKYSEW